jgi:hypothetical protein
MVWRTPNGHPADHELLLTAGTADRRTRRTRVEQHMEDCAACRGRLEGLVTRLDDVTGEFKRLSVPDARSMTVQRARLAHTLAAMPAPRQPWWQPWSVSVAPAWAIAAVVIGVIGVMTPWASRLSPRTDDAGPPPARALSSLGRELPSLARELPTAELTPGASAPVSVRDLCAGRGPTRVVSADTRLDVLRAYGMEDVPPDAYELDALITPELGGTTDARNLWPQRYTSLVWHARVKDVLEERLAADVCAGRVDLQAAQRELSRDWVAAYRRYFKTDVPLQAHLEYGPDERELEPELEFAAPRRPQLGAYPEALALMALPVSRPFGESAHYN